MYLISVHLCVCLIDLHFISVLLINVIFDFQKWKQGNPASPPPYRRFATVKVPFPPLLYFVTALPSPLTGRAAQPPEFSPRDVVGLTCCLEFSQPLQSTGDVQWLAKPASPQVQLSGAHS
jgi:hypothetical protein